jgi:hypothetical protein
LGVPFFSFFNRKWLNRRTDDSLWSNTPVDLICVSGLHKYH